MSGWTLHLVGQDGGSALPPATAETNHSAAEAAAKLMPKEESEWWHISARHTDDMDWLVGFDDGEVPTAAGFEAVRKAILARLEEKR